MNDDFFDYGDDGNQDDFEMETGKWEFEYQDHNGDKVSVVDTGVATDIVTIKADTYTSAGKDYSDLKIVLVFNVGEDENGNFNSLIP